MENNKEFLDMLCNCVPHRRQVEWQNMEYYNFVHFGLNTFSGKEWGSGKESPKIFNPSNLDTDKWVQIFKESGSKGVILTAKHHDGFCLFPSKFTDYSIKNSPYKNGKGDIVKELSDSCRKYGLKFGVYLSPWDRHEATYGTDEYNDFYCNQLEELCTNYGELFCLWFDGACGEGKNGKKQEYDFNRYYDLIRKLQPNAVINIAGPDVRWIGNEGGICRPNEWSVVDRKMSDYNYTKDNFQQADDKNFASQKPSECDRDLGSRKALKDSDGVIWYPAEMDVPITKKCWFYNRFAELFLTRKVSDLLHLYETSVGSNATLLLNVPPNKKGEIPKKYQKVLKNFGMELNRRYGNGQIASIEQRTNEAPYIYDLSFKKTKVSAISIAEDINFSQRIEKFEIYNGDDLIYSGEVVGFKKICKIDNVLTDKLTLKIIECRREPHLHKVKVFSY